MNAGFFLLSWLCFKAGYGQASLGFLTVTGIPDIIPAWKSSHAIAAVLDCAIFGVPIFTFYTRFTWFLTE